MQTLRNDMISSGGAFGIGVLGGLVAGTCGRLRAGLGGRVDRTRRWERRVCESIEVCPLFLGEGHLPGDPSVQVHGELNVAVAYPVLHKLGASPSFYVQRDEGPPKILLPDTRNLKRLQRRGNVAAPDALGIQGGTRLASTPSLNRAAAGSWRTPSAILRILGEEGKLSLRWCRPTTALRLFRLGYPPVLRDRLGLLLGTRVWGLNDTSSTRSPSGGKGKHGE